MSSDAESMSKERYWCELSLESHTEIFSQDKVDGTVLGVILLGLTEDSVPMEEISENIFKEELDKLFMVKIQTRENYI